jgi:hypothetical protein
MIHTNQPVHHIILCQVTNTLFEECGTGKARFRNRALSRGQTTLLNTAAKADLGSRVWNTNLTI